MERIPFNPYDFFGYLASGLLVVVGMQLTMGFPQVIGREFKLVDGLLLLLGVYVAGQMMATPAKALLEDGIVERILRRPSTNLFRDKKPFIRGLLFPGFYKAFPDHTRMRILEKVKTEGVHCSGEDLFLHVRFSPSVRNDEKLISRLNGFLNQYGFNRNLSFSCLLIGTAFLVKLKFGGGPELVKYGFTTLAIGVLLFYRYLKFFRQYSYELFNAYGRS